MKDRKILLLYTDRAQFARSFFVYFHRMKIFVLKPIVNAKQLVIKCISKVRGCRNFDYSIDDSGSGHLDRIDCRGRSPIR